MRNRYAIVRQIEQMNPATDSIAITQLSGLYDFPWDTTRALELALFRTFAVPSIAKLLYTTKEFTTRTQKRYDDTDILLNLFLVYGYNTEEGMAAIRRMNRIHGHYKISNEEMLYVLSTFVIVPAHWVDTMGFRKLIEKEKVAAHLLWTEIGKRMGIKDIPNSFAALEAYKEQYEATHFGFSEEGRAVADATLHLMLSWYLPKCMWGIARPFLLTLMDDALLTALHYPKPSAFVRGCVQGIMGCRKLLLRGLPASSRAYNRLLRKTKTYPSGYQTQQLGPEYIS